MAQAIGMAKENKKRNNRVRNEWSKRESLSLSDSISAEGLPYFFMGKKRPILAVALVIAVVWFCSNHACIDYSIGRMLN